MKIFPTSSRSIKQIETMRPRANRILALKLLPLLLFAFHGVQMEQEKVGEGERGRRGGGGEENEEPDRILPEFLSRDSNFFAGAANDLDQLRHINCHLRNLDFCFAGLIGSSVKALPETNEQLDIRCDELQFTSNCLALYNDRCMSMRVFGLMSPLLSMPQYQDNLPADIRQVQVPLELISADKSNVTVSMADLMMLCNPRSKTDPNYAANNKLIRSRLFPLAKCINARIPSLTPCLDDLKNAIQLFYEPAKILPARPSCCAVSRFRHCAVQALDNICGLSSFDQLESALTSGPGNAVRTIDRFCKHAADFQSDYCREVLPPSGTKIPPRRGSKASKLAKALDLISLSTGPASN